MESWWRVPSPPAPALSSPTGWKLDQGLRQRDADSGASGGKRPDFAKGGVQWASGRGSGKAGKPEGGPCWESESSLSPSVGTTWLMLLVFLLAINWSYWVTCCVFVVSWWWCCLFILRYILTNKMNLKNHLVRDNNLYLSSEAGHQACSPCGWLQTVTIRIKH